MTTISARDVAELTPVRTYHTLELAVLATVPLDTVVQRFAERGYAHRPDLVEIARHWQARVRAEHQRRRDLAAAS